MKRNKSGISLIVLVITIIVMIILASAVIITLNNTDIINRANEAVDASDEATKKHQDALDYLDAYTAGTLWKQTGSQLVKKNADGTKTEVALGTTVNYNAGVTGYTGGWRILGEENGKLLLVSAASIGNLQLSGKEDYVNGIAKLNKMCEAYGAGVGARDARSLTAEDVIKALGFDPMKTLSGEPFKADELAEYGNTVTYTFTSATALTVAGSNGATNSGTSTTGFTSLEGRKFVAGDTVTLKGNYYNLEAYADITPYVQDWGTDCMNTTQTVINTLLGYQPNDTNVKGDFWLATQALVFREFGWSYGLMNLKESLRATTYNGNKYGLTLDRDTYLYNIDDAKNAHTHTKGVRAVVAIDYDTELVETAPNSGIWNIK